MLICWLADVASVASSPAQDTKFARAHVGAVEWWCHSLRANVQLAYDRCRTGGQRSRYEHHSWYQSRVFLSYGANDETEA